VLGWYAASSALTPAGQLPHRYEYHRRFLAASAGDCAGAHERAFEFIRTLAGGPSRTRPTWGNYLGNIVNNRVTNAPPKGNLFFRLIKNKKMTLGNKDNPRS